MLELMKGMLNKASEKMALQEYKTASSRNKRSKIGANAKAVQEENTEVPYAEEHQSEWGYRSAIEEKVTSRFEEPPNINLNSNADRMRVVSFPSNKTSKQRSLDKPKSKLSDTKSMISSKAEEAVPKHQQHQHSPQN